MVHLRFSNVTEGPFLVGLLNFWNVLKKSRMYYCSLVSWEIQFILRLNPLVKPSLPGLEIFTGNDVRIASICCNIYVGGWNIKKWEMRSLGIIVGNL